jgi:hypothetical protein
MAPVTGGVTDGQKDRFILTGCQIKGFIIPGMPVYRVFCMLQQVWTLFKAKIVHIFRFY